jgi:hypothetical protein
MNQTIYFRKDVWEKFGEEKGKSNIINQLLAEHYGLDPREVTVSDELIPEQFTRPQVMSPQVRQAEPFVPRPPDPNSGYPCCVTRRPNPETLITPCKHWNRNEDGDYINSITSEVVMVG